MPNLDAMISKAFSIALLVLDSWLHCVKSVCIRNYSVSYFPEFGLKMKRYSVSLRIQSECEKIWTRITSNMDIFYVVQLDICYEIVNFWPEDGFIKCVLIHRRHLLVLHKEKFFLTQQYFPSGQEYSVFCFRYKNQVGYFHTQSRHFVDPNPEHQQEWTRKNKKKQRSGFSYNWNMLTRNYE